MEPEVEMLFANFSKYGFNIISAFLHYESFGDFEIILESKLYRLRFIKDKGQLFIDIASMTKKNEWQNIFDIFNKCIGLNLDPVYLCNHPDELIEIVSKNFGSIKQENI